MPVFIFRSTDTGAPALNNATGAGTSLLDAVLVNGYNALSGVTVTRSGSTATFTYTNHGMGVVGGSAYQNAGKLVTIAGFDQPEYNITGPISNVTANTWDMTVAGTPTTPGTGTGTAKRSPMRVSLTGSPWTIAYTATSKRVYTPPAGSNGFSLYVDDTIGNSMNLSGWETPTGLNAGSGRFPTTTQQAAWPGTNCLAAKGTGSTIPWIVWGNGKVFFYAANQTNTDLPGNWSPFVFGDFKPYRSGDPYASILAAPSSTTAATTDTPNYFDVLTTANDRFASHAPRSYTGLGSAVRLQRMGEWWISGGRAPQANNGTPLVAYPYPADGSIFLSPVFLSELVSGATAYVGPRGSLPGLWITPHGYSNFTRGDVLVGSGANAGRAWEVVTWGWLGFMEITDTWDQ